VLSERRNRDIVQRMRRTGIHPAALATTELEPRAPRTPMHQQGSSDLRVL
jgi:hypothetical protein